MGRDGTTIVAEGLTRSFDGQLALVDLSFDAQPGEVLALLGPERRGQDDHRPPAQRRAAARLRASAACSASTPQRDGDEVRRRTGVLTENAGLDDRLTARENLEFTGRIRGMDTVDARSRVDEHARAVRHGRPGATT